MLKRNYAGTHFTFTETVEIEKLDEKIWFHGSKSTSVYLNGSTKTESKSEVLEFDGEAFAAADAHS